MKGYEIPFQKEFNAYLKTTNSQTYAYYNKEIFYFLSWVNKYIESDHKALYEVTMSQIQQYIHELIQKEKEIKTINKKITIIKAYYDFLWRANILSPDPAEKVRRIKAESIENETAFLNADELERVSTYFLNQDRYPIRNMAIYSLFLFAGLKINEFMTLKPEHLHLTPHGLSIQVQGSLARIINLSKEEAKYIIEYKNSLTEENHLFTSAKGNKLATSSVNFIFAEARTYTGVNVNPRKLRNTCGVNKKRNGWSNEMIADYLGVEYFVHAKL